MPKKYQIVKNPKEKMTKANKKATVKIIKKVLKGVQELKWHGVDVAPTTIFIGSAFNQVLTAIAQSAGTSTDTTRIGDEVDITSINVRALVAWPPDAGNGQNCCVRFVAYQYKPNNGLLAPSLARLLNNDSTGSPNVCSHQVVDHQADYHILYDKTVTMAALYAAAGSLPDSSIRFLDFWIPMKKATKKLQYDNGTTAHNNAIYLAILCDHPVAATGDPEVTLQARIRFTDS